MTLLDLLNLIKKSWWLVVALPVVCAIVCFGVMTLQPATYSATATLVASNQLPLLSGQASSVASQKSTDTGLTVTSTLNNTNYSVIITVTGENASECVQAANEVATTAREKTLAFLGQEDAVEDIAAAAEAAASESADGNITADDAALYALAILSAEDLTTISITEATSAKDTSPKKTQYVAVAFIAGLLAAICLIVIRDMARGSIHNAYEVEERYDLRQLGRVRKASAKRRSGAAAEDASLLAALDFAGEGKPALCLVPMEDAASAKRIVGELEAVAEAAGKRLACMGENANLTLSDPDALAASIATLAPTGAELVFVMAPAVADSADFAYLAPACGCAVLVLEAMRTKRTHLESALRQLALSKTEVAGFIMVSGA